MAESSSADAAPLVPPGLDNETRGLALDIEVTNLTEWEAHHITSLLFHWSVLWPVGPRLFVVGHPRGVAVTPSRVSENSGYARERGEGRP